MVLTGLDCEGSEKTPIEKMPKQLGNVVDRAKRDAADRPTNGPVL